MFLQNENVILGENTILVFSERMSRVSFATPSRAQHITRALTSRACHITRLSHLASEPLDHSSGSVLEETEMASARTR